MLKKEITEEITSTFLSGVNKGADVLHLENALYRKHNRMWKDTFRKNHLSVNKSMLGNVTVTVRLDVQVSMYWYFPPLGTVTLVW
ncbi:hypothetical protein [Alicyclobacillus fastidiosus]|uniref:hypothetical protein n=1 Tax=Alicyclobacillus fastidiosus TaxID=392011 RepID=UPI0034DCD2FE